MSSEELVERSQLCFSSFSSFKGHTSATHYLLIVLKRLAAEEDMTVSYIRRLYRVMILLATNLIGASVGQKIGNKDFTDVFAEGLDVLRMAWGLREKAGDILNDQNLIEDEAQFFIAGLRKSKFGVGGSLRYSIFLACINGCRKTQPGRLKTQSSKVEFTQKQVWREDSVVAMNDLKSASMSAYPFGNLSKQDQKSSNRICYHINKCSNRRNIYAQMTTARKYFMTDDASAGDGQSSHALDPNIDFKLIAGLVNDVFNEEPKLLASKKRTVDISGTNHTNKLNFMLRFWACGDTVIISAEGVEINSTELDGLSSKSRQDQTLCDWIDDQRKCGVEVIEGEDFSVTMTMHPIPQKQPQNAVMQACYDVLRDSANHESSKNSLALPSKPLIIPSHEVHMLFEHLSKLSKPPVQVSQLMENVTSQSPAAIASMQNAMSMFILSRVTVSITSDLLTGGAKLRLSIPWLDTQMISRWNAKEYAWACGFLHRVFRGFEGRALWNRLNHQYKQRKKQEVKQKNRIESLLLVQKKRFAAASKIQCICRGFNVRQTLTKKRRMIIQIQCYFRVFCAKKKLRALLRRKTQGAESQVLFRKGMTISRKEVVLTVHYCGLNFRLEAYDLQAGRVYQGQCYSQQAMELVNEHNANVLKDAKYDYEVTEDHMKRLVRPWNIQGVADIICNNLAIVVTIKTLGSSKDASAWPVSLVVGKEMAGISIQQDYTRHNPESRRSLADQRTLANRYSKTVSNIDTKVAIKKKERYQSGIKDLMQQNILDRKV